MDDLAGALRALVTFSCGWIPQEPRLHVKLLLAEHAAQDEAAAAELEALGAAPATDAPPADLLAAYGERKPALMLRARNELRALNPLAQGALLAVVVRIAHDQERHLVELPVDALLHNPGTPAEPTPELDAAARAADTGALAAIAARLWDSGH